MASSSTHVRKYHVFPSFHGSDVRRKFLSHLRFHFAIKGIVAFKDQEIERGQRIGPELVQAIRESRVSLVVLSKNYPSSSWCLDELVEILKCKEDQEQIVMPIFYEIDPSDVRKQSGDFGKAFGKTCVGKTKEVKQRWTNALTEAANIGGEHSLNWTDEAEMIEKIVADVSNKLNVIPSRDFEEMVGLDAHLRKLDSLLCLNSDEVKMIGIWGPAGIGKTTIARALYNQLSTNFQFKCFMGNLKGSYKSIGVDNYDWKLNLQNQLLSKILNQNDVKTDHLGGIKDWLEDKKVLIVIDDVDDLEQLLALAKEPSWFGSGSRIIVTTKDKTIMKTLLVNDNNFYHVGYPTNKVALEILCLSAFQKSFPRDGFEELARKVAYLCGNLPLCLSVVGSSLRGQSKHRWKLQSDRLETSLDRKIEDVLKSAYEKLSKKEQVLFLHIACFFNNTYISVVKTLLADSNLDVRNGLKTLADKCLVHISRVDRIFMHPLLQQLGRYIVLEQSDEPEKRQFLVEAEEIRDVLANETGTGSVLGISFDMSKVSEFSISGRAFEAMRNLRFLRIYRRSSSKKVTLRIVEDMKYLPRLRLLHWEHYPRKSLPRRFQPERLVVLHMPHSNLEKLWGGIQSLTNLKNIDLSFSRKLKEIPNLSNATNLETLTLIKCSSLVELPSSISNLQKLKALMMFGCKMLKVVPTNINLVSLEKVSMTLCSQLSSFPDISRNIKSLDVGKTKIEEVPPSVVKYWSRLDQLSLECRSLKRLTYVPPSITMLSLSFSDIETIPDCVIDLTRLRTLTIKCCRKLVSLPGLPPSLEFLCANHCRSLERVHSFHNPVKLLIFHNCLKLDEEARRAIKQQRVEGYIWLPGKKVPAEFTHKATGNSITIPLAPVAGTFSVSSRFKACLLFSPIEDFPTNDITCRLRIKGGVQINKFYHRVVILESSKIRTEHLFIFYGDLFSEKIGVDVSTSEILFKFSCRDKHKIIECGVQIFKEEAESSSSSSEEEYFDAESSSNEEEYFDFESSSSSEEDYFDAESSSRECWRWRL
ncbi:putative TIR domain, AAA+ ATPase domain, P-loop containing nucleoside triphosphate hydrolase [Arabidopsis thaliana]|uniref:TIR domain-containing protein n=2 Tax=Arabidopsis TaxID=3701 RepID=A0A178UQ42_ARATH|nr:Winged helix DNA-binding domain superfamily [Arabidopsis thaliana x Arabidopsis arenosa]OAO95775.1 hypothetical protein AXX17_AT5G39300 [Arabidopsis thaliana]